MGKKPEDKAAYIIAKIGAVIVAFVFAFAFFGSVTNQSWWQVAKDTIIVILQMLGLKK